MGCPVCVFSFCALKKTHIYVDTLSQVCFLTDCLELFLLAALRIFSLSQIHLSTKRKMYWGNIWRKIGISCFFSRNRMCPVRLYLAKRKNDLQRRFVTQEGQGRTCHVCGVVGSCPVCFTETCFIFASFLSLAEDETCWKVMCVLADEKTLEMSLFG